MSIFDTIKYPVSLPPTEEELLNLPVGIYNKWILEVFQMDLNIVNPGEDRPMSLYKSIRKRRIMANAMKNSYDFLNPDPEVIKETEALRQIIKEWDNE